MASATLDAMPAVALDVGSQSCRGYAWLHGRTEHIPAACCASVVALVDHLVGGRDAMKEMETRHPNTLRHLTAALCVNRPVVLEHPQSMERAFGAEQLLAFVMHQQRKGATKLLQSKLPDAPGEVHDAIIPVHEALTLVARQRLIAAANAAGFSRVGLVPSPAMAAIHWAQCSRVMGTADMERSLLVVDAGCRYSSVAVVRLVRGARGADGRPAVEVHILSSRGLAAGGYAVDLGLAAALAGEARGRVHDALLIDAAEKAKKELSSLSETVMRARTWQKALGRRELEAACAGTLGPLTALVDRVVHEAGAVDRALLVGGASRSPILREHVRQLGIDADILDPDSSVVMGAAFVAGNTGYHVRYGPRAHAFEYWAVEVGANHSKGTMCEIFGGSTTRCVLPALGRADSGWCIFQRLKHDDDLKAPLREDLVRCAAAQKSAQGGRSTWPRTDSILDDSYSATQPAAPIGLRRCPPVETVLAEAARAYVCIGTCAGGELVLDVASGEISGLLPGPANARILGEAHVEATKEMLAAEATRKAHTMALADVRNDLDEAVIRGTDSDVEDDRLRCIFPRARDLISRAEKLIAEQTTLDRRAEHAMHQLAHLDALARLLLKVLDVHDAGGRAATRELAKLEKEFKEAETVLRASTRMQDAPLASPVGCEELTGPSSPRTIRRVLSVRRQASYREVQTILSRESSKRQLKSSASLRKPPTAETRRRSSIIYERSRKGSMGGLLKRSSLSSMGGCIESTAGDSEEDKEADYQAVLQQFAAEMQRKPSFVVSEKDELEDTCATVSLKGSFVRRRSSLMERRGSQTAVYVSIPRSPASSTSTDLNEDTDDMPAPVVAPPRPKRSARPNDPTLGGTAESESEDEQPKPITAKIRDFAVNFFGLGSEKPDKKEKKGAAPAPAADTKPRPAAVKPLLSPQARPADKISTPIARPSPRAAPTSPLHHAESNPRRGSVASTASVVGRLYPAAKPTAHTKTDADKRAEAPARRPRAKSGGPRMSDRPAVKSLSSTVRRVDPEDLNASRKPQQHLPSAEKSTFGRSSSHSTTTRTLSTNARRHADNNARILAGKEVRRQASVSDGRASSSQRSQSHTREAVVSPKSPSLGATPVPPIKLRDPLGHLKTPATARGTSGSKRAAVERTVNTARGPSAATTATRQPLSRQGSLSRQPSGGAGAGGRQRRRSNSAIQPRTVKSPPLQPQVNLSRTVKEVASVAPVRNKARAWSTVRADSNARESSTGTGRGDSLARGLFSDSDDGAAGEKRTPARRRHEFGPARGAVPGSTEIKPQQQPFTRGNSFGTRTLVRKNTAPAARMRGNSAVRVQKRAAPAKLHTLPGHTPGEEFVVRTSPPRNGMRSPSSSVSPLHRPQRAPFSPLVVDMSASLVPQSPANSASAEPRRLSPSPSPSPPPARRMSSGASSLAGGGASRRGSRAAEYSSQSLLSTKDVFAVKSSRRRSAVT